MKLGRTLLFGAILAAFGAYIAYVEIPRGDAAEKREKIFAGINKADISSVEISRSEGSFKLIKNEHSSSSGEVSGKDWQIEGVKYSRIDDAAIGGIINGLLSFTIGKPLPADELDPDLDIYGLKSPLLQAVVKAKDNLTNIGFGKRNDYTGKIYVKLGGSDQVYSVDESLFASLNKGVFEVRHKNPIDFPHGEVERLEIVNPDGSFLSFTKVDPASAVWRIEDSTIPGKTMTASSSNLAGVKTTLTNFAVAQFIDGAMPTAGEFGLDAPKGVIKVTFAEKAKIEPMTIRLASVKTELPKGEDRKDASDNVTEDHYFSVDQREVVYRLGYDQGQGILRDRDYYRERQLFSFNQDDFSEAVIEGGEIEQIVVIREGDIWKVKDSKSDAPKEGDAPFIKEWVRNLATVTADSFPSHADDLKTARFDSPRGKITVTLNKGLVNRETKLVLLVGGNGSAAETVYLSKDDLQEPFFVKEDGVKKLLPKLESLLPVPTSSK